MQKRRKVVAAGWYVSAGLVFVLVGIPPAWLDNVPARILLCLLGVICLGGAAYEWWFRKENETPKLNYAGQLLVALDKQTSEDRLVWVARAIERASLPKEPDATLEFAGTGFILRNFGGTACEVRIECDSLNEGRLYSVSFPMVPDLHEEPVPIAPEVKPAMNLAFPKDIMSLLGSIARGRAMDIQDSTGKRTSSDVTDRLVEEMEPISLDLSVSYTDRIKSRRWQKSEKLVYDPPRGTAHIEHGRRRIVATDG